MSFAKKTKPADLYKKERLSFQEKRNRSSDFLDVYFLEFAISAASSVARVLNNDLDFEGTGFMISDRLFLTNNHVVNNTAKSSGCLIEFNYELDVAKNPTPVTRFTLAPEDFFFSSTEEELDFTIVAVGNRVFGKNELHEFGYCPLKENTQNIMVGDPVNIIQHPKGDFKKIVLRENQLIALTDEVLHYTTKTKSGSSGSPVFNDNFEVIGMHHYGEPSRGIKNSQGFVERNDVNEGIRTSSIAKYLKEQSSQQNLKHPELLDSVLTCHFNHPSLLHNTVKT